MDLLHVVAPEYYALAYAGMVLHILTKLAELTKEKKFSFRQYIKKNIFNILATFIMIPILLIISTDTSLKDILPINYVTAVLAGWQTQSLFRTLMLMAGNRAKNAPAPVEEAVTYEEPAEDEDKKDEPH